MSEFSSTIKGLLLIVPFTEVLVNWEYNNQWHSRLNTMSLPEKTKNNNNNNKALNEFLELTMLHSGPLNDLHSILSHLLELKDHQWICIDPKEATLVYFHNTESSTLQHWPSQNILLFHLMRLA